MLEKLPSTCSAGNMKCNLRESPIRNVRLITGITCDGAAFMFASHRFLVPGSHSMVVNIVTSTKSWRAQTTVGKLIKHLGRERTLELAERLTLPVLDRQDKGLGDAWGRGAADAFKACFNGIKDLDLPDDAGT